MPDKVPAFCSMCGKGLVAGERALEAFDPFNGKPITVPALVCPERGDDAVSPHDRWEQNPDNAQDKWEKWDG